LNPIDFSTAPTRSWSVFSEAVSSSGVRGWGVSKPTYCSRSRAPGCASAFMMSAEPPAGPAAMMRTTFSGHFGVCA
jgi:hypothetical protein